MGHNRYFRRAGLMLAAAVALPVSLASAQRNPPQPVPRVMVATFAGTDKDLGVKAADELRNRITRDVDARKLIVIPKGDIIKTLEASGYPATEALQPNDAKALATLLRADEYIDGVVTKTPAGVKVEARMLLSRDQTLGQPLPAVEAGNLGQAATQISKSYQQAREQLAGEKNCYAAFREGKHAEAVTLARSALSKYPNGTIAMVCMINAYSSLGQKDSVAAVGERIVAIDPRNIQALRFLAQYYQETNNTDKAIPVLIRLMAADPGNDRLREDVIASLVRSGKAEMAVPIVEEAIAQNPGDPKTLNMGWRVFLAANQFQKALSAGEEMIRADTALADSAYFVRTAAAAASIDPTRAAQIVSQGVAKFPNNSTLLVVQAATLSKAGQNAQALAAINRALAANPRIENGYAQKALILSAMNMPDSVLNTLKTAAAAGGDKKALAQVALKSGSDAYKAGNASKSRTDLQRAVDFLMLSNQLDTSTDAQFLAGASAFLIGQSAVNEAQDSKSCQLARLAKTNFGIAQENVPAGLTSYKEAAQQLLTAIPQFTPAVDDQIRRFCK
ncbi:MAG TPA: BTAD domain-containing putative transcriptional regulator [Gemmatimonadaceae bacterium]